MECLLASIFNVFFPVLEPSWEGKSTQDRSKIDPKGHQKNDGKKASWKRLGGALGFQNPWDPIRPLHAGAVAETRGLLLGRIPEGLEY